MKHLKTGGRSTVNRLYILPRCRYNCWRKNYLHNFKCWSEDSLLIGEQHCLRQPFKVRPVTVVECALSSLSHHLLSHTLHSVHCFAH